MTEDEIVDYIDLCNTKALEQGYESLSELERIAHLVSSADFEINLGGMFGFYYNSAGNRALATIEVLEKIGASAAANAIRQSITLFPKQSWLPDREYRQDVLITLGDDPFNSFEDIYQEQDSGVWDLLVHYIRDNFPG